MACFFADSGAELIYDFTLVVAPNAPARRIIDDGFSVRARPEKAMRPDSGLRRKKRFRDGRS
jgi:hypothetical protein